MDLMFWLELLPSAIAGGLAAWFFVCWREEKRANERAKEIESIRKKICGLLNEVNNFQTKRLNDLRRYYDVRKCEAQLERRLAKEAEKRGSQPAQD